MTEVYRRPIRHRILNQTKQADVTDFGDTIIVDEHVALKKYHDVLALLEVAYWAQISVNYSVWFCFVLYPCAMAVQDLVFVEGVQIIYASGHPVKLGRLRFYIATTLDSLANLTL
jgi:hypothetical protein